MHDNRKRGTSGVNDVTVEELFSYIKEHKEETLDKIRNINHFL